MVTPTCARSVNLRTRIRSIFAATRQGQLPSTRRVVVFGCSHAVVRNNSRFGDSPDRFHLMHTFARVSLATSSALGGFVSGYAILGSRSGYYASVVDSARLSTSSGA